MSTTDEDIELRRLMARSVSELLAKEIEYTMAIPVVRSLESDTANKKQKSLIQRLWTLPGTWKYTNGMEVLFYLSDTAEIVALRNVTVNSKYTVWIHQVTPVPDKLVPDVLRTLMEFREAHGLES